MRLRAITVYVWLVCVLGVGAAVFIWVAGFPSQWFAVRPVEVALVVLLIVIGELRPLPITRGDETTDRTTISTTFVMALLIVGPPGLAVTTQGAAVVWDDLRRGKGPRKALFNFAQYTITLSVAYLAFVLPLGHPFFRPIDEFRPEMLGPALLACLTFFVLNNTLVALAVALDSGERVRDVLLGDIGFQASTAGVLLCLSPVAALVITFSGWMLPLLVLPILAVYRNADLIVRREHEAFHDDLTGLPNRLLLHERTSRALAHPREPRTLAMLLLDLDHFKEINDTLGHHVGDDLLRQVARRLVEAAPETSMVARLGGDEFAVVLSHVTREEAATVAARLVDEFREPFTVGSIKLAVAASTGIALAPDHGDTVHTLLRKADVALYQSKDARVGHSTYDPSRDQHDVERLKLLADLRPALDAGEFILVFQPQVDLPGLDVVGIEALVRWKHARHGLIPPDRFLPLVESSGLSVELSRQVLDMALRTAADLARGGHPLGISVNLSARELTDRDLPSRVLLALAEHDVPAERLTIEVTEGSLISDTARTREVLGQLRTMGVRLAVDDFGTGYSSLAYLKSLEVDELKIDRSFVTGMPSDDDGAVIVRSTIEMGHSLGLCVVAEGVEDAEAMAELQRLRCDRVQGFFIASPMLPVALTRWLAERHHDVHGPARLRAL